jgi:5'-phosphate synthase pdxT subunit
VGGKYGILALQGAFAEHDQVLRRLGVEPVQVRLPSQLRGLDALIIPGGESTTIKKLAHDYGLAEPLQHLAKDGMPVWGTCAGMILLAKDIGQEQPLIGEMDIVVERNAFGRQVDSFEVDLTIPELDKVSTEQERGRPFRAVFIRAPAVQSVGSLVEPLAHLPDGTIVAVRQEHLLATAFHPELSGDSRFHRYFQAIVQGQGPTTTAP